MRDPYEDMLRRRELNEFVDNVVKGVRCIEQAKGRDSEVSLVNTAIDGYLINDFRLKRLRNGVSTFTEFMVLNAPLKEVVASLVDEFDFTAIEHVLNEQHTLINDEAYVEVYLDSNNNTYVRVYSSKETIRTIFDYIGLHFKERELRLNWVIRSLHGFDVIGVGAELMKLPHDSFYPWLNKPLHAYYDEYLKSKANVLVLSGPPGTGKTSFIKGLLEYANEGGFFTYDEEVLDNDSFFTMFLKDKNRFLILEDADKFLTQRTDGNSVMQKFLNLSEGLIDVGQKKIILTTNVQNVRTIDQALLRPGRCFDLLQFRALEPQEAQAAAQYLGLEIDVKEPVTLAQLTNPGYSAKIRQFGFGN